MTQEPEKSAWDLETGLPNDFDGWITKPRFGEREDYAQAVIQRGGGQGALMFLVDLVNKEGELEGTQGYSVGTGWIVSDDGLSISHPKRQNVVKGSRYGDLQLRVIKDLGVDMNARGKPTDSMPWDGLGFHWMQEEHATVGGDRKATGIMPTEYLGERKIVAAAVAAKEAPAPASAIEELLVGMVNSMDRTPFQLAAMKKPEVAGDDALMAKILDDGPEGFYSIHKKS